MQVQASKRRPGRPANLTAKGQQTRQRILESASRLIGHHGVARLTLEDVRADASVSSSQIYHYFADKQSLLSAVVDYQHDVATGDGSMFGGFESTAAVRSWGDMLVEQQRQSNCRGGCPIASLGTGLMGIDSETLTQLARIFRRCEDDIRDGYRAMHATGDLAASADPDALATMTLATAIGGLVLTNLNRNTEPLEAAFNALLACLQPEDKV